MPFVEAFANYFPEDLLDESPLGDDESHLGDDDESHLGDDDESHLGDVVPLPVPTDAEERDRRWWVLRTKHQQEKALARQLLSRKIPFYLPLVQKEHLIRGKRVQSHIPLFGCYVFIRSDDEEYQLAMKTNRVLTVLHVPDQQQLLDDLRRLRQLIASGQPITMEKRLKAGQKVRVRRGPFTGQEGTILKRRGASRLLVLINFLQQGASVALDDFVVEPIT